MKKTLLKFNSFLLVMFISLAVSAQSKIKVACIGNSITFGAGLKNEDKYPVVLQQLLGDKYEVGNYGVSGRTLLKKGDYPYWAEKKYADVLAWQPDIIVIKLGTNDTKPQNWQYKDDFIDNYVEFVNSLKQLASHPKIYLCYPIKIYPNKFNIRDSILTEMIPEIKKIKKQTGSKLIDLYKPFIGHPDLYLDGVHPNKAGAVLLAERVYKAIK